jgi:hypothetical protein
MHAPRSPCILQQCCPPIFPFAVPKVTSACGLSRTRRIWPQMRRKHFPEHALPSACTSRRKHFPTRRIWPQMRRRKGANEVWDGCGGLGGAGTGPALLDRFGYAPGGAQALADAALLGVDVELGVLIKLERLIQKLHLSPPVLLAPVPRQPQASRILFRCLSTLHMGVQETAACRARNRPVATSNQQLPTKQRQPATTAGAATAGGNHGRRCASLVLWCYGAILFCTRCSQPRWTHAHPDTCTPGHMHTWTLPTSMLCCRT